MHKPLLLSTSLFAIVTVSALGLAFFYNPILERSINEHDAVLQGIGSQSISGQRALVNFYSQLNNIDNVLDERASVAGIANLLQKGIHKNVYVEEVELSISGKTLSLTGYAGSEGAFSEQIEALQRHINVEIVTVKDSQDIDDVIKFNILLSLHEEIFE